MPNFFRQGDTLVLPAGGVETLTAAISDALKSLSMTRCPYYEGTGKCDRGCYSEPSCHTDQPLEGWVGAAIQALEHALPEDQGATLASREPQQTETES